MQSFECPSCGAALNYEGDAPVVRCAYCDSVAVVPESMRPARPVQEQKTWTATPFSVASLVVDLGGLVGRVARLKEVKELVREGRDDEAMRLFQEITGTSGEEAEMAIQRLASGQSIVLSSSDFGASIPVVSGTRILSGQDLEQALQGQIGATEERQRRARRRQLFAILAVIIGALVFTGLLLLFILAVS